jgi:hypothetical protein
MEKNTVFHRVAPFLVLPVVLLCAGSGVRAQTDSAGCRSFLVLEPDLGGALSYSFPLHYGTFADVEVGASTDTVVQIEVTVFEDSAIEDRRIWTLIPGRVELLTEILDVENLFEIGEPLLVRIEASGPVSATLVRE